MNRIFRWIRLCGVVVAALGALLFVCGLAMPSGRGGWIPVTGILGLISGMGLWAILLIDRMWRFILGLPPRSRIAAEPPTYRCPTCGYRLRGVEGVYCPECGTVRPAPIEGEVF